MTSATAPVPAHPARRRTNRLPSRTLGARVQPARFGRQSRFIAYEAAAAAAVATPVPAARWSDDIKLFASTFAGGFLFVTIFLA